MKRKMISMLLALALVCALLPAGVVQAAWGDIISYAVKGGYLNFDPTTGEITYCDDTVTSADIPSKIGGVVVTSIGEYAFSSCSSLTSVTIPGSVTSIGEGAFWSCNSLTNVTIPKSVTSIGNSAFGDCSSLTSVTIPDSVTSIGERAFSDCSRLASVTIPGSVTSIGEGAFGDCSRLTSVTIPGSVTSIGDDAFSGCYRLTSVTILAGVTSIGDYAFYDCDSLTSVTIPGSVTSIGDYTFWSCDSLTSATILEGVPSIGDYTFWDCGSLTSVTLPDSVTEIGYGAFSLCSSLKDVYYTGSDAQWHQIRILSDNESLTRANIHFHAFLDVPDNAFYADAVAWAVGKNITTGTAKGKFSPLNNCTRGQIVTFLWRANGSPEPTSTVNPFVDVPKSQYYYKAVLWAVEQKITTGIDATHFKPDNICKRGQAVTFQWRAAGEPVPTSSENPFVDVPADQFYHDAVLWAVEREITTGTTATTFKPDNTCTRGHIVTFLYRDLVK